MILYALLADRPMHLSNAAPKVSFFFYFFVIHISRQFLENQA